MATTDYFKYPVKNVGFHSSWTEENDDPTRKLSLGFRKEVYLKPLDCTCIHMEGEHNDDLLLIKSKDGDVKGLSDGAGSSLVKRGNNKVYKIKRNGYKYHGFIKEHFRDSSFSIENDKVYESTYFEHAGLYRFTDALREIKISNELEKNGFLIPHKPVSLYKLNLNSIKDADYGIVMYEVDSNFRCDEFVMGAVLSFLGDYLKNNKIKFDVGNEFFLFDNLNLSDAVNNLYNSVELSTILDVSRNIGTMYRNLHDLGYIRGIGNSWYGNEIIYHDGRIGLCDFDSTFHADEMKDFKIHKHSQNNDLNLFVTGTFSSLSVFSSSLFEILADLIIQSFKEGYKTKVGNKISEQDINGILERYFELENIISY